MKLLGLRPFGGRTLDDVLRYLRVDVASSFADLFTALSVVAQADMYREFITVSAKELTSATELDLLRLDLGPGIWDIHGSVLFDLNSATGSPVGEAWLSTASGSQVGTVTGYSLMAADISGTTPVYVFRRIILGKSTSVYLGVQATFGSGPVKAEGSIYAFGRAFT